MMKRGERIRKYIREYTFSDIIAMLRNNKADPAPCSADFRDRLVVITGATSGIGYFTARTYARHGANLLCINRNPEKSRALREEIESEFGVSCREMIIDMSRLDDVHRAGHELAALSEPIDVLIHNAGLHLSRRTETVDGLETVFMVNYLSSFVLNYLVKEKLVAEGRARVLMVNSEGHRFAAWGIRVDDMNWERRLYQGLRSYGSAKTAQLLSMFRFAEIFAPGGVTINAMHPGEASTQTGSDNGPLYQWFKSNVLERNFRSPQISADALYYLGVSDEVAGVTGKFFNLTTRENPAPPALDRETADALWEASLRMGRLAELQDT
jgi:NAD(P)-dependent dehydrogenase (short-subunit alcohol dehydrogenase family)